MSDVYNVRSNGQRYYVYRIDGNVQVAEFFNASEAQANCAIRNQRHNEQFGKKKQLEPTTPDTSTSDSSQGFVEKQLAPEQGIGKGYQDKPPDPPPGQGVSY